MKANVIVFPGSNCDRDVKVALEKFQIQTTMVWHQENKMPKSDLVVLPGGFSYGDYLRCGSMASKSNIMNEVIKHADKGGYLIGICNGFQILTETGLLPGALLRNKKLKFICKYVNLLIENNKIEETIEKISNHQDEKNPFEQSIDETIASQSEKRKSHLEAFNHKFTHQFHKIDNMEKEPAYKRKGLDVNSDVQDSPSRLSLDKDNNDDLQIRSNNSFLHDNVD